MNEADKTALTSLLGFVGIVALVIACATGGAPEPVPAWALHREAVWRLEVAMAIFVLLYVPISAVALARQGRLFTKFSAGPASAEAELAAAATAAADESTKALEDLRSSLDQVRGSASTTLLSVAMLTDRVAKLEERTPPAGGNS